MALSEEEQRLLAQLEASLAVDDPKLASVLRGTGYHVASRRTLTTATLGFVVGLAVLVLGLPISEWLSVAGFVVMLASCVYGLRAWQRNEHDPQLAVRAVRRSAPRSPAQQPHHTDDSA